MIPPPTPSTPTRGVTRRLRGPVFHILLALGDQELHGYAIMQRFEEETGEVLLPGTLYSSIGRMLEEGLIQEVTTERSGDDDPRRRYYRVTELGREAATTEAERMCRLVDLARQRSLLPDPGR